MHVQEIMVGSIIVVCPQLLSDLKHLSSRDIQDAKQLEVHDKVISRFLFAEDIYLATILRQGFY